MSLESVDFISTPIGDLSDITARALKSLSEAQCIIVEEYKYGKKMLDQLGVNLSGKELLTLNEHNEKKEALGLAQEIFSKWERVSVISDAGQPAVADPGQQLISCLIDFGVRINYLPGASSIMGALMVSGLPTDDFYYAGFLPRKDSDRNRKLQSLSKYRTTIIIMEAPYRLNTLVKAVKKTFPGNKRAALCFDLTCKDEYVFRGSIAELYKKYGNVKMKRNFVLLVNNR